MKSSNLYQEVVSYISSDQCDLTTVPGSAVVSITERSPIYSSNINSHHERVVRVFETTGGKELVERFANEEITEVQKGVLWAFAEAKYISSATGDIKLVATKGEDPSRRFVSSILPQLMANPQLTSYHGIPSEKIRHIYLQEESEYKFVTARILSELVSNQLKTENLKVPSEVVSNVRSHVSLNVLVDVTDRMIEPQLIELSRQREAINHKIKQHYFAEQSVKDERLLRKIFANSPFYKIPDFFADLARKREYASLNAQRREIQREIDSFSREMRSPEQMEKIFKVAGDEIKRMMRTDNIKVSKAQAKVAIENRIERIIEHHRFPAARPVAPLKSSEKKTLKM